MLESQEVMEAEDDLVSSLQRCKLAFEGYLLHTCSVSNPLHVDMQMHPPPSPPETESPPLSPGMNLFPSLLLVAR